jgi:antitoxin MazE
MKTRIVRMGNTLGVRIPKRLLDETGLTGEVEIAAEEGLLIVGPVGQPRAGWEAAFAQMARRGDDVLLDELSPSLSSWDEDEWEW